MSTSRGSILITGANGGIGVGIVDELLKSSYAVTHEAIYIVRDPAKALALEAAIKNAPTDHHHQVVALDLESLDAVRTFAAGINERVANGSLPPIQALVLNAGVQDITKKFFTKDGMERTFVVNYLVNFLLTLLLLKSIDKKCGRIVFVGSTGTKLTWAPNRSNFSSDEQRETLITSPENMAKGIEEHPDGDAFKTGMRSYAMSKLLCMEWMYELQRRLDADPELYNISVLGLDPGWVGATGIFRYHPIGIKIFMNFARILAMIISVFASNPLLRTPSRTGKDMLRVCFDKKTFGEYPKAAYVNGSVMSHTPEYANDEAKQKELWKGSLELASIKEGDTVLQDWR